MSVCANLLPLAFSPGGTIPGAFGTVWSGDVWIENRNSASVQVYPCYLPYMCGEFGPGAVGRFSNPEFYYPDRGVLFDVPADQAKKLRADARLLAVKDAKEKASALASELGQEILRPYQVSESSQPESWPRPMMAMAMDKSAGSSANNETIALGQVKITSSVNASFELK